MIVFRHADRRLPFLQEGADQPPGRWHGEGEGPLQYFADTPDGAWAEFLRHEELTSPEDLRTVTRAIWVVEVPDEDLAEPSLSRAAMTGGAPSWERCRSEARRLGEAGHTGFEAPSAALRAGGATGWRTDGGLRPGPVRDGRTIVLFGRRPDLVGWRGANGRPSEDLLGRVRPLG